MGERKGQNKYYPPDFNWKRHNSLNAYQGVHALHERARKLDQGILIIRFEMPFNIWCDGCNNHIGMGVRYNAEKKKIGMYYSTPLWRFRMKCHLCDNHIELETDPKNMTYFVSSGGRRQDLRWDPKTNEQVLVDREEDKERKAKDPMFMLEHRQRDVNASAQLEKQVSIGALERARRAYKFDYDLNSKARAKFRDEKSKLREFGSMLADEHADDVKYVKDLMEIKKTTQKLDFNKRKLSLEDVRQKSLRDDLRDQMTKVDSCIRRRTNKERKTGELVLNYSSSSSD